MDDNLNKTVKKKKWDPPIVFSLAAKKTAGGGDPAQTEDTPYSPDPVGS